MALVDTWTTCLMLWSREAWSRFLVPSVLVDVYARFPLVGSTAAAKVKHHVHPPDSPVYRVGIADVPVDELYVGLQVGVSGDVDIQHPRADPKAHQALHKGHSQESRTTGYQYVVQACFSLERVSRVPTCRSFGPAWR